MRVLVTGGAGFIGSCLVSELLHDNQDVLVYDNFSTGSLDLLPSGDRRMSVAEGDIVDHERVRYVMNHWRPSVVFHLAAIHYIPYCDAHPMETLRVNVEGTQSVLEACKEVKVGRVVAASSAAVYGISDEANRESDPPGPMDIYGVSKWTNEVQLRRFHEDSGIPCLAARLFNVYGFNETNPHVIPAVLEQLSNGDEIQLGNLEPARDFVYVRDVARALIALAGSEDIGFGVFNVGTGREYSIRELVEICQEIVRRPLRVRSVASRRRPTDRWHLLADISRIVEAVGWRPQYDLGTGLAETMAAMAMIGS
jgi:UDP-glucose 4-epimerase